MIIQNHLNFLPTLAGHFNSIKSTAASLLNGSSDGALISVFESAIALHNTRVIPAI